MKHNDEIKDELLEKVNGGGSGTIPAEGITFSIYHMVEGNYYYSKDKNFNDVVYVFYDSFGRELYTFEKFTIDQVSGTWSSKSISTGVETVRFDFDVIYPYKLNVRP